MKRFYSILIPTHNRSQILARTLESLAQIRIPEDVEAELIVVANACTDDTEAVVAAAAQTLRMTTRCIEESKVGLSAARNRAVLEALGDTLAFLDDDVWVEPDWLIGLHRVFERYPADIVGGRVFLWWEAVDPPVWMHKGFETLLSGYDHGDEVFELMPSQNVAVLGANFSFTKHVWNALGGFSLELGRKGKSLLAGEETEFVQRAKAAGFRLFYAPDALVKHWVAPHRITFEYLHRLAFDFGRTSILLMPECTRSRCWKAMLEGPPRACLSFCGEVLARILRDPPRVVSRRLGALSHLGCCVGAWQVLRGTSPLDRIP